MAIIKKYIQKLTIVVPRKFVEQYRELSKWEKIFIVNFYDQEYKIRPINKANKYEQIRADINVELERLYALADNAKYFSIDPENNPDLEREYKSEIKALFQRGEGETAKKIEQNKNKALNEMAKKFSDTLQAEYKQIVDYIKSTSYEPAFKLLMLRETLNYTYKKFSEIKETEQSKTQVEKRIEHKTIAGHMLLNQDVLSTIYNDLDNYESFANLYFAGVAISQNTIAKKSGISIVGINTFNKGKWLKFEGKQSNKKKYIKNAQELASLVQNTPWCTKTLASSQLEQGDFFVFVDNENKPHIAVEMRGNTVDEVRGIKKGNAQELEDDYRDVAIEFLSKNKEVEDGEKWLKKEEWNKQLIELREKIEAGIFKQEETEELRNALFNTSADYKTYVEHRNFNLAALKKSLPKIKPQLAKYFNCEEDEICFGDYTPKNEKVCPYVIIFGDADFRHSKVTDLGRLTTIGGYADFENSQITSLDGLSIIGGYANFYHSKVTDLGGLTSIGDSAFFRDSQVTNLRGLTIIDGDAFFGGSKIACLSGLTSIGGDACFSGSKVTDLGGLINIGRNAHFENSQLTSLGRLTSIGGDAICNNSNVTDLGNLTSIGGCAFFIDCPIKVFDQITHIGAKIKGLNILTMARLKSTLKKNKKLKKAQQEEATENVSGHEIDIMEC